MANNKMTMGIVVVLFSAIGMFYGVFIMNEPTSDSEIYDTSFHITLADPTLYVDGVYEELFNIEEGTYEFGFVPNGDSPEKLSIMIAGFSISFSEDFELQGTLIEDGISSYYTWEYLGEKRISVNQAQEIKILIDPNGNYNGPVSVDLNRLI